MSTKSNDSSTTAPSLDGATLTRTATLGGVGVAWLDDAAHPVLDAPVGAAGCGG